MPALLQAFVRLVALKRLGVLLFVLAATLCATNTASAFAHTQTKTCVWDFELPGNNSSGLLIAVTSGKHQGNRSALSEVASGSLLAPEAAAANGNSLLSQNAQRVYEILRTDEAGSTEVFKYGISGGPLNAAGLSVRAETQVSALTRAAGGQFTFESSVVRGIPGGAGARGAALSLERNLVYDYLELTGAKPIGNIRP